MELKKTVYICGTADSLKATPLNKDAEYWGTGSTFKKRSNIKYDLIFELHDGITINHPNVLSKDNFPLDKVFEYFSGYIGNKYFTSTISYMIAYAIYKGFTEIFLYGVALNGADEYKAQRQAVEYWIGIAEGRGIKVFIAENEICWCPYLYAYEKEPSIVFEAKKRILYLKTGINNLEARKINKLCSMYKAIGAGMDDKEIIKIENEIKLLDDEVQRSKGAIIEDKNWLQKYSY